MARKYKAYHGTPSEIGSFDISYVGRGNDQEGPGIYFTSDRSDALGYANGDKGHLIEVVLNLNKVVPLKGSVKVDEIKKLTLWSLGLEDESGLDDLSEEKYHESALSNFGEDVYSGYEEFINVVVRYTKSPHDAFQQVWYDLYRNDPVSYLRGMVRLGYDGVVIPKQIGSHYIVYNTNVIERI
jgi:hypothetical protein